MLLRYLPLVAGLVPIVAIHASLLIAINAGVISACFPYFDGCTSISATGRYEPASFLFKPAMIAESIIMIAYWLFNVAWLRSMLLAANSAERNAGLLMGTLGSIGALFLLVYVTFLGSQEPVYEFMRRFGVYLYFALTIVAQLMIASRCIAIGKQTGQVRLQTVARIQLTIALVPFALGILNLILKASLEDADAAENIIEWIFALLMHCFFLLTYCAWRETGFTASYSVGSPGGRD